MLIFLYSLKLVNELRKITRYFHMVVVLPQAVQLIKVHWEVVLTSSTCNSLEVN